MGMGVKGIGSLARARIGALLACALLATGPGVPLALALLAAGMAQAASTARGGSLAPLSLSVAASGVLSLGVG